MGPEHAELRSQLVLRPQIICVKEAQELAASSVDGQVAARGKALIPPALMTHYEDAPWIGPGDLVGKLRRTVGGTVVDEQQFPRALGLASNRLDCRCQVFFLVEKWDCHRDERVGVGRRSQGRSI
jgi:hypothetical protein